MCLLFVGICCFAAYSVASEPLDVEKVLPELVRTDKDGRKSLSYDKLTAVLVEAIKAQQVRMENQEAEIASQRSEIEELKAMVREMASKKL